MIEIRGLSKTYQTPGGAVAALQGVDLAVERGAIFGIIGPSGAGKSTLLRCLNRLEEPDSGTIRIGDRDITALDTAGLRAARRKIGMIFQHFNLFEARTVFGNVAFPLEVAGYSREEIRRRVEEIVALVELDDKLDAYPAQLSGGQQQRVGIARALANNPDLLLCDEATSSLDPRTTRAILDLLRTINRRLQLTIVMITHEMEVVRQLCSHAAVLDGGRIAESGPVVELLRAPHHPATRQMLLHPTATEGDDA